MVRAGITVCATVLTSTVWIDGDLERHVGTLVLHYDASTVVTEKLGGDAAWERLFRGDFDPLESTRGILGGAPSAGSGWVRVHDP